MPPGLDRLLGRRSADQRVVVVRQRLDPAQRPGALEVQLGPGAQVDDVGDAELVDEVLDVRVGEVLEVVGADQPPGCRAPAVDGRQACRRRAC